LTNSLVNTRDRATPCKGPELLREIVAAGSEGIYQGLVLLLTLGFGAFLVYSTVRHGGAMALDFLEDIAARAAAMSLPETRSRRARLRWYESSSGG
jgi:hypothetical protein